MAKARTPRTVFGERVTPSRPDRNAPTPAVFGTRWERKPTRPGSWQGFDNQPADDAAVNTAAPAITSADTNVGTVATISLGTWTGATSLAAELRHVATQTVVDTFTADGTYQFADTDFGQTLKLYVVAQPGDVAAESDAVGPVAEVPSQTLGAELLTNGDFSAWTTDNPNGWTVVDEGSGSTVSETASGGGAGTGSARFVCTPTNPTRPIIRQAVRVSGSFYEDILTVTARSSGSVSWCGTVYSAAGSFRALSRAASVNADLFPNSSTSDFVVDNAGLKLVTPNAQLTAPSANMRLEFLYTLPGTPLAGDCVWLLPRISNFASGNYWLAFLRYTGSQWDINLYSVASHTRTSRIAATNIGATDGIRIDADGDDWELSTRAAIGGAWTSRGTANNSTYNTATGVNAMYTSSVTPGALSFANP